MCSGGVERQMPVYSEVFVFGGASLLDEEWAADADWGWYDGEARHAQSKHSEISVLGVMDCKTNDQIVPIDRQHTQLTFSGRYGVRKDEWQRQPYPPHGHLALDSEGLDSEWYAERRYMHDRDKTERR
ncbi:unnamed protein product [Vitrella brassicaformis CCMP3155]|uniref:Uncharacterized protein n=1 Tax=Vitrella brassicaformis (strain CCMP3155) TaxID=1169540 RepID=A0A0G4H785_VITBC|nr:unnamed protein product [Vitrella brassicaformis CCMP3155]|eukprot:CEM39501.1 unnamed protein product [Vitrella brassicaformis CCMP3155]